MLARLMGEFRLICQANGNAVLEVGGSMETDSLRVADTSPIGV
jgi:hypothetical protein